MVPPSKINIVGADAVENRPREVGFLDRVAKTVASVARQVAPIATAIPIPQAQIIGGVADLIVNAWADTIVALADEWRAEPDDGAR